MLEVSTIKTISSKPFNFKSRRSQRASSGDLFSWSVHYRGGMFKPEGVDDSPFIHPPTSPRLGHIPLWERVAAAANIQIQQWLPGNIIREVSWTPAIISPLLVAPKPHSCDLCLCLDFWYLNTNIHQIFAPAIDRQTILGNLTNKNVYSTIDVSSAFMCITITRHMETYFAFQNGVHCYVFERLPFR